MLPAKGTILLELETLGLLFLVLHAGIVDSLAFGTLEMDDLAHRSCLVFIEYRYLEPSTGIEPVTSSLPRTCSTN